MLFTNEELKSVYDFEHDPEDISDDKASVAAVAKEIDTGIYKLCKLVEDNKEQKEKSKDKRVPDIKIVAKIPDNLGNPIIINVDKVYTRNRELDRQSDIAKELYQARTIQKHLLKMGIYMPEEGTPDYKRYLQLLYFFYMAKNVIFQDENFFLVLERYLTTELSPVDRAPSGKYSYFILNNLLENDAIYECYVHRDEWLSKKEWSIVNCLENMFADNNIYKSETSEISVQDIICSVKEVTIEPFAETNILDKMVAWIYRYTAVAYAQDMVNNLRSEKNPFQFPEIEISHDPMWEFNKLTVTPGQMSEDIHKFLLNKDCIQFCKQDIADDSPSDETKGKAYSFVQDFIEYDRVSIRNQMGHSMFVEIDEKGTETITELYVALIVKTFIDISKSKQDLYMQVPKSTIGNKITKWKDSQKLARNLTAKAVDLAMRLFVVALRSEQRNVLQGHGSYIIFEITDLKIYYLTQVIRLTIYETNRPDDWVYRSLEILAGLQELERQLKSESISRG